MYSLTISVIRILMVYGMIVISLYLHHTYSVYVYTNGVLLIHAIQVHITTQCNYVPISSYFASFVRTESPGSFKLPANKFFPSLENFEFKKSYNVLGVASTAVWLNNDASISEFVSPLIKEHAWILNTIKKCKSTLCINLCYDD